MVSILVVLSLLCSVSASGPLGNYLTHHERLSYDTRAISSAQRFRRSAGDDRPLTIEFLALGRHFRLRLRRAAAVFADDAWLESGDDGVRSPLDTSHIYHGELDGELDSYVHGSLSDGVFHGSIHTADGSYNVEKLDYHVACTDSASSVHHSFIYADSHLKRPTSSKGAGPFGGCALSHEVAEDMRTMQEAAASSFVPVTTAPRHHVYKYTQEAQQLPDGDLTAGGRAVRSRRSLSSTAADSGGGERGTCPVSIHTGPLLWEHFYKVERDAQRTVKSITSLVSDLMIVVNRVMSSHKFDGQFQHRRLKFSVKRLLIHNDSSCGENYRGVRNKFCERHLGVSTVLNMFSQQDHSSFCLSYLLTYRDFEGGTLGLAWVAAEGSSGGVCEQYRRYNLGGLSAPMQRSLNTGVMTLVNYGSQVPLGVSQLTLAHEIGHNLGSPHDFPDQCVPGGADGNYIMYSSATDGRKVNNNKFSPCSVNNISIVLDYIRSGRKQNCFIESEGAFCGNKIQEPGEECDCGYDSSECDEVCCYASQLTDAERRSNISAKGCARRAETQCSPSEGPCCDRGGCRFVSAQEGRQCRIADECTHSSYCDGNTATCPASGHRADLTLCNNNTMVCLDGVCEGSICIRHNLSACFLSSEHESDLKRLCEVACQPSDNQSSCTTLAELGRNKIYRPVGSPCDNFKGYCDVFNRCRLVNSEGPLLRLKTLLFSQKTLMTITDWVTMYWWAVVLMAVLFAILMALFIRCFAVHTPSSNPRRAPARRLADTLKHPMGTLRRQHRPRSQHQQHQLQQQQGRRGQQQQGRRGQQQQGRRGHRSAQQSAAAGAGSVEAQQMQLADLSIQHAPARAAAAQPSHGPPPPPYSQPVAPPTRHGFGEGRGHYSRQASSDEAAAQRQNKHKSQSSRPRAKR